MPWFTKKERRMQVSAFPAIFKADFGRFRRVSAISAAGRYDPIWPDFGRISRVRRESKPIRHESSRIGANWAESARIWEKKKRRCGPTRGQPRRTPRPASRRVGHGCGTSGAAFVLSRSLVCSLSKTFFLNLLLFLSLSCFPASTSSGCCVNWFKKTKER